MRSDFFQRFHSALDHRHDHGWDSRFSPRDGSRGRHGRHGMHGHHHRQGHGHDVEHGGHLKRLLAHGDLRFVVLLLIEEKPRHGYELIKLIESKSSGQYAPSPGVIYPTLTYLEETGLVLATLQNEKKQYSITSEGLEHLGQNREMARGILQGLEDLGAKMASAKAAASDSFEFEEPSGIRPVLHAIMSELRGSSSSTSGKTKKKIVEILQNALGDIQKLIKEDK